jgi:hypothetical protein
MDASAKKDIRTVILCGVMGSLYTRLTVGAIPLLFITKCLRVPKTEWALAAALIPLSSALHLGSAVLTERLRRRKALSLICFALGRLATPAIAILPFLRGITDTRTRVFYLGAAFLARGACNALGTSAWLSWVTDIVPEKERGRYYAIRLALNTLIAVTVMFSAGRVIDLFGKEDPLGYVLVFAFAFFLGELDLLIHARVPDRPMPEHPDRPGLWTMIATPWRHAGFRSLMLYRSVMVFGNGMTGLFAIMYLEEQLGLSATGILGLQAVLMLCQAPSFFLWRRIGERVGYRTVAQIAATLAGVGIVYWWFLPHGNLPVLFTVLVLARVYFGVVSAGTMLSNSTLNMNVAPEKHRSTYFAQVTTIVALAMAAGVYCGRQIFVLLEPTYGGEFLGTQLTPLHVLIGLLGLVRILSIRLFYRSIPDARAEAALPRIDRVLRTNALRVFPMLLPLERPVSTERRAQRIESIKNLIPEPDRRVEHALEHVLKDAVHDEDEFIGILDRVRDRRARDVEPMVSEIADAAPDQLPPAKADRIKALLSRQELAACLRTITRLAREAADGRASPRTGPARFVIDQLAARYADTDPPEEAVQIALYAYLQVVRGHQRDARTRSIRPLVSQAAESAAVHLSSARARAAANRILRLYRTGELGACLRTVHRLAHQTADEWQSPYARASLAVIDALTSTADDEAEPHEDAVLLAIYAYLQIVREPEGQAENGG